MKKVLVILILIIGVFLLLYGIFRILTIIVKFKKLKNNQNDEEE